MAHIPHPNYFEGILQLRGEYEEVLQWLLKRTKEDDRAAITKHQRVGDGIDLYFTSQRYLQILAKQIKMRFAGIMKLSSTLHTQKKGQDLYRITVLFRVFPFKIGDIVTLQGERIQILGLTSKAHVKEVDTGKKKYVSLELLTRAR